MDAWLVEQIKKDGVHKPSSKFVYFSRLRKSFAELQEHPGFASSLPTSKREEEGGGPDRFLNRSLASVEGLAAFFQLPSVKAAVIAHLVEQSNQRRQREGGERRKQLEGGKGKEAARGTMVERQIHCTPASRALNYFLNFIGLALTAFAAKKTRTRARGLRRNQIARRGRTREGMQADINAKALFRMSYRECTRR
jgi:hypothetical protein